MHTAECLYARHTGHGNAHLFLDLDLLHLGRRWLADGGVGRVGGVGGVCGAVCLAGDSDVDLRLCTRSPDCSSDQVISAPGS